MLAWSNMFNVNILKVDRPERLALLKGYVVIKFLDTDYATWKQSILESFNTAPFDVDNYGESLSVDIWVEKGGGRPRFNCPLFVLNTKHPAAWFEDIPKYIDGDHPGPFFIGTSFLELYLDTSSATMRLDEVVSRTMQFVKQVEVDNELRDELYYQFKKYMGYPVEFRPPSKRLVAYALPGNKNASSNKPSNSKKNVGLSSGGSHKFYPEGQGVPKRTLGGFYQK